VRRPPKNKDAVEKGIGDTVAHVATAVAKGQQPAAKRPPARVGGVKTCAGRASAGPSRSGGARPSLAAAPLNNHALRRSRRAAGVAPTTSAAPEPGAKRVADAPRATKPAPKRSRRLAAREPAASGAPEDTIGALQSAPVRDRVTRYVNRASCSLFAELGVPVATARLATEVTMLQAMGADMVAVTVTSVLDESFPYIFSGRYSLSVPGAATDSLQDLIGVDIARPHDLILLS